MEYLPQMGAPVVLTQFAELAVLHSGIRRVPVPKIWRYSQRRTHQLLESRVYDTYSDGVSQFEDFAITDTELPILELSFKAIVQELQHCSMQLGPGTRTYYSTGRTEWDLCALNTYEQLQEVLPRLAITS